MKFSLTKILTASVLLAFATLTIAAPLQDVSVTSVDLTETVYNSKGDEHLYVTVTRIDDLIDDDGSLLAERVMAVKVTFDVVENQLMCNGKPVDIGVSSIQVEAQMVSNPEKLIISSDEDAALLADSFDLGLVTVEVTATVLDELKTDDGMIFRRINVKELITEVNGLKVVQTEAGQQILDIFDNGSFMKWFVDPLTGFMLPGPALTEEDDENTKNNVLSILDCPGCEELDLQDWWNNEASTIAQCLMGALFITLLLSLILGIRYLLKPFHSYAVLVEEEEQEDVMWDTIKKQQQQPPAYVEHEEKQPLTTTVDTTNEDTK
ncbi:uncharacterized protein BX663DRAFT_491164 [Cokeromyces recurvatus]|uniref:uncharacterized protein n=1 Tax=Cokeromyces recurvatus TaxID=90255 RepID=UPI00221F39F5|nr:uncharacterized protein BX663DRAFT_491164 [Cokeromyces recurvatus]KAI7907527.1 hypothetical protein BX663DRAFT_491164 [Cokeromyces recurvatus]